MKKLVGYQERDLLELRRRYHVDFDYDTGLVTDNLFGLNETSPLFVYGRGIDVIKVCHLMQLELEKLVLRTIHVSKEVCQFLLVNIKELKSFIDPTEIRIKKIM